MKYLSAHHAALITFLFILSGTFSITAKQSSTTKIIENCSNSGSRTELTYCQLMNTSIAAKPVDMLAFVQDTNASMPTNQFEGRLILKGESLSSQHKLHKGKDATKVSYHLPEFDFEFIQDGHSIIPVKRGVIQSYHAKERWEYILEPGKVWNEISDHGFSRVAIPFALQQTNQNCVHNGVLSFIFKNDGSISNVFYQVSSETCLYYKVDLWGKLEASYLSASIDSAAQIKNNYKREVSQRMTTKPLSKLVDDYPDANINLKQFSKGITAKHMTSYGLIIDDIHYVAGCNTRKGVYPFCDVLVLPSFSVAKSIFAGAALMRLEYKFPGAKNITVPSEVPTCKSSNNWKGVTLEDTLDMVTGNYSSRRFEQDENRTSKFFNLITHKGRIDIACKKWPKKEAPGKRWVYHTTDTYVVTTAMNSYLKKQQGVQSDIFNDLIVNDLWKPLALSPTSMISKRSYGHEAQAWGGYGLNLHRDDVAKIGKFMNVDNGKIGDQQMLDPQMLREALQKTDEAPMGNAVNPPSQTTYYKNGFWAFNAKKYLKCKNDIWIPFMSGFGGITVSLLPNGITYYSFSDNNEFIGTWAYAAAEANKIRPMCEAP